MSTDNPVLEHVDAAKRYNVKPETLTSYRYQYKLKCHRILGKTYYYVSDLEELFTRLRKGKTDRIKTAPVNPIGLKKTEDSELARTTLRLTQDMKNEITVESALLGITEADALRLAIQSWITRQKRMRTLMHMKALGKFDSVLS
jgi:hypothetical protein